MSHDPAAAAPATARASAGVHFPPPFVYALGILAGWALQRWRPWPITAGHASWRGVLAAVCALIYLLIFASAATGFRRARTTLIPNRPASALVTTGIYGRTRNPMYVSLVFFYLAFALWLNSWWMLVLVPVVIVAVDRLVIAREERYLASAFPDDYRAYRARVRRWI
ncbi:MAG: isoprenylcysteine carboxylmethyltransferase family protein [Gemmatimonadaceae bacterium]|nr:isoprenylcysteine carboxylmethyltransferase family protein [Gemmatimonadaceae bacterium]NUQ93332.1 isoprenylcysteine carboxylmethyltransferase family protein [Gemmatimonadaceae bacterium]NUR35963.1 isoprenylcysteine carboxylmethyltransferase family protein [Gemmatimonadaceae bacterium]NUS99022.1 isoprenylcysteine carboxylmethyltransferase family protein [Gemmatimonadaceae bacterium]